MSYPWRRDSNNGSPTYERMMCLLTPNVIRPHLALPLEGNLSVPPCEVRRCVVIGWAHMKLRWGENVPYHVTYRES